MPPVWKINLEQHEALRKALAGMSFSIEERPTHVFLARRTGCTVNLYLTGTVLITGSDGATMTSVEAILRDLGAARSATSRPAPAPIEGLTVTRIGTDESGKGDYFGPLVVAGLMVTSQTAEALRAIGVRDSKALGDKQNHAMAGKVRRAVGPGSYTFVVIKPERYNQLHDSMQGANALLGWAHARVIENLLKKHPECGLAVVDQFGDDRAVKQALMEGGRKIRVLQSPKAERDVAVAPASVLARSRFLRELDEMSKSWGTQFPKGASYVLDDAARFVAVHGEQALQEVVKLHFGLTRQILSGRPVEGLGRRQNAATESQGASASHICRTASRTADGRLWMGPD